MIDIHCHILPDVDDGPKSWESATEMCRMALADGIEHMVATPHSNERYHYDREYLSRLLNDLRERIGENPKLSLGCDFHMSYENLQSALSDPDRYCIEGTHYMLAEFSNYGVPPQLDQSLTQLRTLGITPIITHPERNPILQQNLQRVLGWIELGCAVQITASTLTGFWGAQASQAADWLLKNNAVHVVATDAHDTKRRVPILSAARASIAETFGSDIARALVEENPRAIIRDKPLPYFWTC
ncbi:MAG: CpsB/CapC family capsule biosynthesis tyrosine phosphatase [Acidobacteriaceae bacterium]